MNICLLPVLAVFGHGHHWSGLRHLPPSPGTCLVTCHRGAVWQGQDYPDLIQPWLPALTLDLPHHHELAWGFWAFGWSSVPSIPGLASLWVLQGRIRAREDLVLLLVYHPQLWLLLPWEAAAPCCGHFRAVCYNLQLHQGRKITKTANFPPEQGVIFLYFRSGLNRVS